jgi:uncharacterized Zn-finger protein
LLRVFNVTGDLLCFGQHLKIHSAEARTQKCGFCGWSTYCQSSLRKHLVTHTGEKRFVCEVCGKSYPHRSGLQMHMTRHSDEPRPHKCD